ncbi:MAG: hypothetical protein QM780_08595 [Hyphomicrobium sp.]|uniref:hypothetical protein n=1 Tax=Hyphomicrobium sp. TaxID=82 RepID=UPI0039E321A7
MKCIELADALKHLEGLYRFGGGFPPQAVVNFEKLLGIAPELSVAQLGKKLDKLTNCSGGSETISVQQISALCEEIALFLKPLGKPPVVKEIRQLAASLNRLEVVNPDDLTAKAKISKQRSNAHEISVPRSDLVQLHLRSLEQALGDDAGFTSAFRALETDPNLGTNEYIALAKHFSFASTKSKSAALKKIWARHQALMTSRAKAAATAGRIAG